MKLPTTNPVSHCMWLLAAAALVAPAAHAATVFADDFSEPSGTAIIGKAPDIGSPWTGNGPNISATNTFDTTGAGRAAFGQFTSALSAGQILTLSYDTLDLNNFFGGGYAGVSLYVGGTERLFTGDTGGGEFWGIDGGVTGFQISDDATSATTATLTYEFDTGEWTFSTTSGVSFSGTGVAGEAFDNLRIANGNGGDLNVDNLSVDISAVPEPSSMLLLGLGCFGFFVRRR